MNSYKIFTKAVTGSELFEEQAVSNLNTAYDAFALAAHVWALQKNFELVAINDEECGENTQLDQYRWTKLSPNSYTFKYTLKSNRTSDSQNSSKNVPTTMEMIVTKLGQRSVQLSIVGSTQKQDNSNSGKENEEDEISCVCSFPLSSIVDTSFFVNEPRESEEIRDVYVSPNAISAFWQKLDSVANEFLSKLPQNSEGSNSEFVDSEEPSLSDLKEKLGNYRSNLLQSQAAAESSPSPASISLTDLPGTGSSVNPSSLSQSMKEDISKRIIPPPLAGSDYSESKSDKKPNIVDGPPGFEDEYQMGGSMGVPRPTDDPLRISGPHGGGMPGNRGGYGDRDLYPPGMEPYGRLPGSSGMGGGMNPTFEDLQRMRGGASRSDDIDELQRPPGARFDPTGPSMFPPGSSKGGFRFGGGNSDFL